MEELLKKIVENAGLAAKLQEAWKGGASAPELAQIVSAAGIEIASEQVEEALASLQSSVADGICSQEVDEDQLAAVAGGGSGMDCVLPGDCDRSFQYVDITDRCSGWYVCDEYFAKIY